MFFILSCGLGATNTWARRFERPDDLVATRCRTTDGWWYRRFIGENPLCSARHRQARLLEWDCLFTLFGFPQLVKCTAFAKVPAERIQAYRDKKQDQATDCFNIAMYLAEHLAITTLLLKRSKTESAFGCSALGKLRAAKIRENASAPETRKWALQ